MAGSIATHARPTPRRLLVVTLVVLATLVPATAGRAGPPDDAGLVVMTQNLYLGSGFEPALAATTLEEVVVAAATIFATVQYTDFPTRAGAIADQVAAAEPDLIGLQEVALWTTTGDAAPPGYDFLSILLAELGDRGLDYDVAAVSDNARIGPVPLAWPGCVTPGPVFTCALQFDDRDVILVNRATDGLTWSDARSGRYATQASIPSPVGPISFTRGWTSIEARLDGQPFRFVNTHLEVETFPAVQQAQAAEFLAGPAAGGTVIAVGDFNSATDGSTTTSYDQLTAPGRFRDAWDEGVAGLTCCQASDTPPLAPGALNNPLSTLATRIDLVLGRGAARALEATVVGDQWFQGVPPFWPSDHAGVVASFRL